ncbi:MAG: glutamate--tRNA ligase [Pseudomonadota bacterium]
MKPVVRFAPSPTGRLHVGNVRTALINWLFAKGQGGTKGGTFILRIDDTDTERSTAEYEQGIKDDLTWLGLAWDDTFNQSAKFDAYDAAADTLRDMGLLYACYETADELERKRKIALSRGRPPVYDRAALALTDAEKAAYEAEGRQPHWRFKLSGDRCEWEDCVRGTQSIDTASISDPVLIRGDGSYLYTLPSVVDDIDAKITHVVRGEDHVTNSGAQIEIFRSLGSAAPEMAHTPLLVGADGQGLSKRLGSLSIRQLADDGVEPLALASLLARIGTSDTVELGESLAALAEGFSFDKIGRAPARFDEKELWSLNASRLHGLGFDAVKTRLAEIDPRTAKTPLFWETVRENCERLSDVADWAEVAFGTVTPDVDAADTDYMAAALASLPEGDLSDSSWGDWTGALKAETGRKGKGLFMPLRKALTGRAHGPNMAAMLVLIGRARTIERLEAATARA